MGRIAGPDGDEKRRNETARRDTPAGGRTPGWPADGRISLARPAPRGSAETMSSGRSSGSPSSFPIRLPGLEPSGMWMESSGLQQRGLRRNGRRACRRRHRTSRLAVSAKADRAPGGTGTPRLRQSRQSGKPDVTCGLAGAPSARGVARPRLGKFSRFSDGSRPNPGRTSAFDRQLCQNLYK